MSRDGDEESRWGGLVWGLALIGVGVTILVQRQGLLPWDVLSDWWPLFVVFLGVVEIAGARTAKKLGSGVTLMLMGGYFYASVVRWNGLNWSTSWPLALVAIGVGMVVEVIAARFMPRTKSDRTAQVEFVDE